MIHIDEAEVEYVALDYFHQFGCEVAHGPDISPGGRAPEREEAE